VAGARHRDAPTRCSVGSCHNGFPLYAYPVNPAWIARFQDRGHDIGAVVDASIAADAAVLRNVPDDVTVALHTCRGNHRSSWMCEGSLEPVAERMFGELPYDVFLVEWDDLGRDGGFEPVRHLREGERKVICSAAWMRPRASRAASTDGRSRPSAGSRA
jgi:hypothetical protein